MKVEFTRPGWDDSRHWREADPKVLARIIDLIEATRRDPFKGIGKPEPLVGNLEGTWSRRITGEHRLVYVVLGQGDSQSVKIVQCRYHYRR